MATAITQFDDRFTVAEADAWFANAQRRILSFHPGIVGGAGNEGGPKTTLIELVRTILPEIMNKSYYRAGEFAEWNAANMENDALSTRLSAEMVEIEKELQKKKNIQKALETLHKPVPATLYNEILALERQSLRVQSSLMGAEGPIARIANRKDTRRKTLRRRQDPFIQQIKPVIEHSTLLTPSQRAEVTLFVDGLVPYFRKKHERVVRANGSVRFNLTNSSNNYRGAMRGFTAQLESLIHKVTGSEHVRSGLAHLTANTRAAAAAVSRVPGLEDFNSLANDILFHPTSQVKDEHVIELIASMTPEMFARLEERMSNEANRQAIVARLKGLRPDVVPKKPDDVGFDKFAELVRLVKQLKERRHGGGRRRTRRGRQISTGKV